jgi:hypothetical protein
VVRALDAQSHTRTNFPGLPRDPERHRSVESHARDQENCETRDRFANVSSRLIVPSISAAKNARSYDQFSEGLAM